MRYEISEISRADKFTVVVHLRKKSDNDFAQKQPVRPDSEHKRV